MAKENPDYLQRINTFTMKNAEVDTDKCAICFTCDQDSKYREAVLAIRLPPDYI